MSISLFQHNHRRTRAAVDVISAKVATTNRLVTSSSGRKIALATFTRRQPSLSFFLHINACAANDVSSSYSCRDNLFLLAEANCELPFPLFTFFTDRGDFLCLCLQHYLSFSIPCIAAHNRYHQYFTLLSTSVIGTFSLTTRIRPQRASSMMPKLP